MIIKFTPTEKEMIIHRLEVPDALADCHTSHIEDNHKSDEFEEYEEIASDMWRELSKGLTLTIETEKQRSLLADCLDGSTWFNGLMVSTDAKNKEWKTTGWIKPAKYKWLVSVAEKLEERLKKLGIPVTVGFPVFNEYFAF